MSKLFVVAALLPFSVFGAIGDRVQTSASTSVRMRPCSSATLLGSESIGAVGTVTGGPIVSSASDGFTCVDHGYTWWHIYFDSGAEGWVRDNTLTQSTSLPAGRPLSSAVPLTFFGMHWSYGPISVTTPILAPVQVGALGKASSNDWQSIEYARGSYDWSPIDSPYGPLAFAKKHGVPYFIGHQWIPEWATADEATCGAGSIRGRLKCGAAPADLNVSAPCQGPLAGITTTNCMWKEFVTTLVRRYKGIIEMYEGWNEPLGIPSGATGSPMSVADFAKFEGDFLATVRANDPAAKVCSPAFIMDPKFPEYGRLMDGFFANGGPRTYDCYGFHISTPDPEQQIPLINQFKGILARYGIANPVIYATEGGRWGTCSTVPTDDFKQAFIARIELLYWSNRIARHYWFTYGTCAPMTNQPGSSTLTALGIAYGNVQKWMIGATMTQGCAPSGTVWSCGLTRPGGYKARAVWNTSGTSVYTVPADYTVFRDLNGITAPVIEGRVTIGPKPILLEASGALVNGLPITATIN